MSPIPVQGFKRKMRPLKAGSAMLVYFVFVLILAKERGVGIGFCVATQEQLRRSAGKITQLRRADEGRYGAGSGCEYLYQGKLCTSSRCAWTRIRRLFSLGDCLLDDLGEQVVRRWSTKLRNRCSVQSPCLFPRGQNAE